MSRRTLWLLAAAIVLVAAGSQFAPVRVFVLYALGRSPDCPWANALAAESQSRKQQDLHDRLVRLNKLVRSDGPYDLYATPRGEYWIPAGSRFVLPFNMAEQERKIYGEGSQFVQPADVVLDGGANVGTFTREALDAGAKLVVAIEPAPENLECLRRNFAAEVAGGSVIIYPKGVWNKLDLLTFYRDPANSAADSFVLHHGEAKPLEQKIPLTTIDALVEELKIPRVDFIKLDIEGAEVRALEGAKTVLARDRPRLAVSVYHESEHPRQVPRTVLAANPEYKLTCGPCAEDHGKIRPDIYWFR